MGKNSKKNLLINFVIDGSGSMGNLRQATIDGFNQLIDSELAAGVGETYVTETVFNTRIDARFVGQDARSLPRFGSTVNPFNPNGGTALYDAVGVSITGVDRWLANNRWFRGKVLTVIWTDGGENSSREYNQYTVDNMIKSRQESGWVFQFMGTGEEGWRTAAKTFQSIPQAHRVYTGTTYDSFNSSYGAIASNTTSLRSAGSWNLNQSDITADDTVASK